MEFKKLYPMLRACQDAKASVLVESKHGIGKSTLFKDFAKVNDFHFEHLFAPQFESAGDVLGLPYKEEDETTGEQIMRFTRPDWLNRMWIAYSRGKKSVLLVDEFNRANEDIRQMGLAWFLDHRINGHEFPPNTLVATAINPDDKGDYSVNFLDPAQISRFVKIKLDVDHKSWVNWANENDLHSSVVNFLIDNPQYLHNEVPGQDMNSDPRAWEILSRSLIKLEDEIKKSNSDTLTLHHCVYMLSTGKVGHNAGVKFTDYYKENSSMELKDIKKIIEKSGLKKIFSDKKFLAEENKVLTDPSSDNSKLEELKLELFPKIREVAETLSQEYEKRGVQVIKLGVFAKDLLDSLSCKKDQNGKEVETLKSENIKDNIELLTFLYSLPPETLASTLKEIRDRDTYLAICIGKIDSKRHLTNSVLQRTEKDKKIK